MKSYANENKIIILLSRLYLDEAQKEEIKKLLCEKLSWDYIIVNCYFNKVTNVVYNNLIKLEFKGLVRYQILNVFATNYNYTTIRLEKLKLELVRIVKYFQDNRVNYSVLKGFALSDKVYSKYGENLRDFNDIDILVDKEDLGIVTDLLNQMGYIQGDYNSYTKEIEPASRNKLVEMKMTSHQLYEFCKPIQLSSELTIPSWIDINFTIFEGGKIEPMIPTCKILQQVEEIYVNENISYKSLNNYYMFIQLAYHLYKESSYQFMKNELCNLTIMKFCDIREFYIKFKNDLNLEFLTEIVNKYNLNEAVYFVLYFTVFLYDDLDLDRILERIKPADNIYIKNIKLYKKNFMNNLFHSDFTEKK